MKISDKKISDKIANEMLILTAEKICVFVKYFYRATCMHSVDYAVARCLSVRLSVTCQYCA